MIVQYNFPKLNARCIKFVFLPTCILVNFHISSKPSSFYDSDFRQYPPKEKIFLCSRKVFTLSDISLGWQQFALTSLLQARLVNRNSSSHPKYIKRWNEMLGTKTIFKWIPLSTRNMSFIIEMATLPKYMHIMHCIIWRSVR